MNPFSLLIKPAGADCNLRCQYCFYIDHLDKGKPKPRMSVQILEKIVSSYMQINQNLNYVFGFQGGEPTLMGLEFFKTVIELQKKHAPPGATVSNGLQTNATLITEEMAEFFGKYKFLLGVSLDGPAYLHDNYRKTIGKTPTHHLVMRGIENLKKYNVEFNILTLINNESVKKAGEIYNYLKKNEFYFHQYIPCVEFGENNKPLPYSISGREWGDFLCELFDEWVKEDTRKISVRLFDSILEYLVHGRYNVCYMNNNCCQYFVVDHDGSIYPCDFFIRDDLVLGNIKTSNWDDFLKSPIYLRFGKQKAIWNKSCDTCPFVQLCNGDCQKFRLGDPSTPRTLSRLCQGWKKFYAHTYPRFKLIAEELRKEFNVNEPAPINLKFGRNEPCPCGSGKKYKYCCMM
ncbi:MAG: anaerobic sulfatase maturase [Promethearchaeota archaeon]